MRHKRPLLVALLCWLLVLAVPKTRQEVVFQVTNAAVTRFGYRDVVDVPPFKELLPQYAALLQRYPHNKSVQIVAALYGASNLEVVAQRYPDDAYILSCQIEQELRDLRPRNSEGDVTLYPLVPHWIDPDNFSPRESWEKVIALARKGQQLEPENTFFDWVVLYCLHAQNLNQKARPVLAKAANKTKFDSHKREATFHAIEVRQLQVGYPVSPSDLLHQKQDLAWFVTKFRRTTNWILDDCAMDWKVNNRNRAIDTALAGIRLNRTLRRDGDSLLLETAGRMGEQSCLSMPSGIIEPYRSWGLLNVNSSLPVWKRYPGSLYSMAKQQSRHDLLPELNREWQECQIWRKKINRSVRRTSWLQPYDDTVAVTALQRLRLFILAATPSLLLVGLAYRQLAKRFPTPLPYKSPFWKGVKLGALLLFIALAADALLLLNDNGDGYHWTLVYAKERGLLHHTISWTAWGFAAILICYSLHLTNRQMNPQPSLLHRLKHIFSPPEDHLTRFDFGWLLELSACLTLWIIFLGALILTCTRYNSTLIDYLWTFPAVFTACSVIAHVDTWWRRPQRRASLFLSFHLAFETIAGFFVLGSVLYAVLGFALLQFEISFQTQFEARVKQGELRILRSELGL